jgi:hypothetical protein
MRIKGLLPIALACGSAPLCASAHAQQQIYCAAQVVEKQPLDEWKIQYNGPLRSVMLIRHFNPNAPRSVIICARDFGAVAGSTSKLCRIIAVEGRVTASLQDASEERFQCTFPANNNKADNNDQSCRVVCE